MVAQNNENLRNKFIIFLLVHISGKFKNYLGKITKENGLDAYPSLK